jgi:hypothetical protein
MSCWYLLYGLYLLRIVTATTTPMYDDDYEFGDYKLSDTLDANHSSLATSVEYWIEMGMSVCVCGVCV